MLIFLQFQYLNVYFQTEQTQYFIEPWAEKDLGGHFEICPSTTIPIYILPFLYFHLAFKNMQSFHYHWSVFFFIVN